MVAKGLGPEMLHNVMQNYFHEDLGPKENYS